MIDLWRLQSFIGLLALSFFPLYFVRRIGWVAASLWCYTLISSLCVFHNPAARYQVQLDQTTGQAFALLVMIPLGVLLIPAQVFKHWRYLFVGIAAIESLFVIAQGNALMIARSFDAATIAVMLPLAPPAFFPLYIVGMLLGSGFTAALIMAAQAATFFRLWVVGLLGGFALLGFSFAGWNAVFDASNGRLEAWRGIFSGWDSYIFGTGIGTFQWLSPMTYKHPMHGFYLQMHNDYLQTLYEGGALGLILLLAFIVVLLKKSYGTRLFVTVVGLGAFMLTYHPLHFFITSLLAACVARGVLEHA